MVLVDALAEPLQSGFDRAQMTAYEQLNNRPVEGIDYPGSSSSTSVAASSSCGSPIASTLSPTSRSASSHTGCHSRCPESLPGGLSSAVIEKAWTKSQEKLAGLTRDAVHVIAKRSSHYIMFTQPKLVIAQVKRVVAAARR